jgi:hypothetical protein
MQMVQSAIEIWNKFLSSSAPLEVNISSWIRAELEVVIGRASDEPEEMARLAFAKYQAGGSSSQAANKLDSPHPLPPTTVTAQAATPVGAARAVDALTPLPTFTPTARVSPITTAAPAMTVSPAIAIITPRRAFATASGTNTTASGSAASGARTSRSVFAFPVPTNHPTPPIGGMSAPLIAPISARSTVSASPRAGSHSVGAFAAPARSSPPYAPSDPQQHRRNVSTSSKFSPLAGPVRPPLRIQTDLAPAASHTHTHAGAPTPTPVSPNAPLLDFRRTVTATTQAVIAASNMTVSCDLFVRAELEVTQLMSSDSLVRYLRSPLFREFEAECGSLSAMLQRMPTTVPAPTVAPTPVASSAGLLSIAS